MAAALEKNVVILKYQKGVDDKGDPKFATQRFSKIKDDATDDSVLSVGNAINTVIASEEKEVFKEETYILS